MNEITRIVESMNPHVLGAFVLLGAAVTAFLLINALLDVIGSYKMFRKADEKGWKAFVPFLNDYTRFKLCWDGKMYIPYIIANFAILCLCMNTGGFASALSALCSLVVLILSVMLFVKMAKSYGKDIPMAILLMLFPGLGAMILGFGSAEYKKIEA